MTIAKFTTRWDGWTGGPGYTNWYVGGNPDSSQTDGAAAAIKTFLEAVKGYLPTSILISFIPTVQIIAEADGSLAEQRNIATLPAVVTATGTGTFSAPAGVCVTWRTMTSTGRRLLMGRTFLVPMAGSAAQTDGTLAVAAQSAIVTAGNAYVNRLASGTPGRPVVWRRPKAGASGFNGEVVNCTVTDKVAVLRSRRD